MRSHSALEGGPIWVFDRAAARDNLAPAAFSFHKRPKAVQEVYLHLAGTIGLGCFTDTFYALVRGNYRAARLMLMDPRRWSPENFPKMKALAKRLGSLKNA